MANFTLAGFNEAAASNAAEIGRPAFRRSSGTNCFNEAAASNAAEIWKIAHVSRMWTCFNEAAASNAAEIIFPL